MNKIKVDVVSLYLRTRYLWCNSFDSPQNNTSTVIKYSFWFRVGRFYSYWILFVLHHLPGHFIPSWEIVWLLFFSLSRYYLCHAARFVVFSFGMKWIICCFNCTGSLIQTSMKIKIKCNRPLFPFDGEKGIKLCYFMVNESWESHLGFHFPLMMHDKHLLARQKVTRRKGFLFFSNLKKENKNPLELPMRAPRELWTQFD